MIRRGAFVLIIASTCMITAPAHGLDWSFVRGDFDGDEGVGLTDALQLLTYLYLTGPSPPCLDAADANDDGVLNIADPIFILGYAFVVGPPLPPPLAVCGADPTTDDLNCASQSSACPCIVVAEPFAALDILFPQLRMAVGDMPISVSSGDLDGDSDVDLITLNQDGDSFSVLMGATGGGFESAIDHEIDEGVVALVAFSMSLGELNGDGILDLVFAANDGPIKVRLGNGDGTFADAVNYFVADGAAVAVLGDLNGDTSLDVVAAAAPVYSSISVLLGNGDGTFGLAVEYDSDNLSDYLTVADVNNDEALDVVALKDGGDVIVHLGDGDGGLESAQRNLSSKVRHLPHEFSEQPTAT